MSVSSSNSVPSVDINTPMKTPGTSFAEMISTLKTQESKLRFTSFGYDSAWELGSTIRKLFFERYSQAEEKGLGLVIRIELFNGLKLLECVVGDGPITAPANLYWVQGKFNVVKRFSKSSLRVGREIAEKGGKPEDQGLSFPDWACHGGGFPIWVKGVEAAPIGAIIVSGLAQLEDHQLIVDAITQLPHLFEVKP